jgi:hypothetical protein
MKIQAKGKIKRQRAEKQKELEETAEIEIIKTEESPVYWKGEVSTREIKQVWADEIEAIYQELGGSLNRASAEDKALTIIRHMRLKGKVKFVDAS